MRSGHGVRAHLAHYQYNLFDAVRDKIVLLMQFDENRDPAAGGDGGPTSPTTPSAMAGDDDGHPAVTMLIKNTDNIPVR